MYRKVITYHFLLLFLLCSFEVGVKSHYCGGKYIGSRLVSGDGEITCGMKEDMALSCETGLHIKKKCCENFLAKLQFHNDFGSIDYISVPVLVDTYLDATFFETESFSFIAVNPEYKYSLNPPPDLSVTKEDLAFLQVLKI